MVLKVYKKFVRVKDAWQEAETLMEKVELPREVHLAALSAFFFQRFGIAG